PELAERYFRGPEGFVYRVAVLGGDENGRLVYSSDSDFGKTNIQSADASINLIGPPSFGTGPGPVARGGPPPGFGFFGSAGRRFLSRVADCLGCHLLGRGKHRRRCGRQQAADGALRKCDQDAVPATDVAGGTAAALRCHPRKALPL